MSSPSATLTLRIVYAMVAGIALGATLNALGPPAWAQAWLIDGVLDVLGTLFISALKMLVVPLVFVSLVNGVAALPDLSTLGRIGIRTLGLYLFTTALAVTIALSLATWVSPGSGINPPGVAEFTPKPAPPLAEVLTGIVPSNPVAAMADGEMLQIIVFAILFGAAITRAGVRGTHVLNFFRDLDAVVMHMVEWIMRLAPIGVFALITQTFASQGLAVILPLAAYFFTLTTALLLQLLVVYPLLLKSLTGLSPLTFLKKMRDPAAFAFSTASSGATIPVTLATVQQRMGVKNSVASFTIPLGATINMDGTAMMQGVATVFIATVYAIDLSLADYALVVVTATLASIGTAAIPSVGLVTLAMVLSQVGVPVEGIALILGVDRLLDMLRTTVNVTGDCAVTCVVAHHERALDRAVYDDPNATVVDDSPPVVPLHSATDPRDRA